MPISQRTKRTNEKAFNNYFEANQQQFTNPKTTTMSNILRNTARKAGMKITTKTKAAEMRAFLENKNKPKKEKKTPNKKAPAVAPGQSEIRVERDAILEAKIPQSSKIWLLWQYVKMTCDDIDRLLKCNRAHWIVNHYANEKPNKAALALKRYQRLS